jgi:hypothetical protein
MKRFSEMQKKSKVIRRINEAEGDANLPSNYQDMSKEDLLKLMAGQSTKTEIKEEEDPKGEEQNVEVSEGGDVVKFFSKLFESREMAHVYHLTVKGEMGSHAAHTALNDFYDGILGFIDEMIEVYQGQYGIVEGYETIDTSETKSKDKIEYFEELANFVKSEKKCFKPEDSHILNIVDEAVALIYKTLYKLKYNK